MNEAAPTLLGVAVGAIIAGAFTVIASLVAKRSADADRDEARAARLFDARRTAYEEFQSAARLVVDSVYKGHVGLGPELDLAATDDVVRLLGAVRLYASPPTTAAAENLLHTLNQYIGSDRADVPSDKAIDDAYAWADDALKAFSTTARADLG